MLTEEQKNKLLRWDEDFSNMPYDYMYKAYLKNQNKRRVSYQDTFNRAARHMLEQGKRAYMKGYLNMYETKDGLKSPIRVLIREKDWIKPTSSFGNKKRQPYWIPSKMEYMSCDSGLVAEALLKAGHDLDLCKKIQRIHDDVDPKNWIHALNRLAESFKISGVKRYWSRHGGHRND